VSVTAHRQLCTFRLADLYLGVDAQQVQEVLTHRPMTRVPLAPLAVRGLINLRGQIVPALDLRARLMLPPTDRPAMNVVVRTDSGPVSFLVDEIGDVMDVSEADFERPPATVTGITRKLIRGAYKLFDRLLLDLDAARVADLFDECS
jgi:purine-binding chemotaxis protein CheW